MESSLTPEVLKFSAPVFMADAGVYTTTRVQGGALTGLKPMQLSLGTPMVWFFLYSNITIEIHHF
jgi:hypothetical protein